MTMQKFKSLFPITHKNIFDDLQETLIKLGCYLIFNGLFVLFLFKSGFEFAILYMIISSLLILIFHLLLYFNQLRCANHFCEKLLETDQNTSHIELQKIKKIKTGSRYTEIESYFVNIQSFDLGFEISCKTKYDRAQIISELLRQFINGKEILQKNVYISRSGF